MVLLGINGAQDADVLCFMYIEIVNLKPKILITYRNEISIDWYLRVGKNQIFIDGR